MKFKLNKVLASLLGLTISMSVFAEDIELYVNHDVETDENPRVLMIFDTSGSMAWDVVDGGRCYRRYQNGQFYESDCFKSQTYFNYTQQCYKSVNGYAQAICEDSRLLVAKNAVSQLVTDNDDIDFGLMRFRESSGGYVLARLGSNKNTLLNEIDDLPASGATPLTETLWEAYRYITGQSLYYGYGINNRDKAADAAAAMKVGASDLIKIGIVDEIILEPTGGAHQNFDETSSNIKTSLLKNIAELSKLSKEELLSRRYNRLLSICLLYTSPSPRDRG